MEGLGDALRAMLSFGAEPLEQDEPNNRADGKRKDSENSPEDGRPIGSVRRDADEGNVEHEANRNAYAEGDHQWNRVNSTLGERWHECADAEREDY
jgi:hypothetical protein